jgi:60 kDa SS-A/Ro ribonucleoprotein
VHINTAAVAGQDQRAGRCLRLNDGAPVPPFGDAADRQIAESFAVYSFSDEPVLVPARRGFALRDAIDASQRHNSTQLGKAIESLNRNETYDRLVVITDEQAHDSVPAPRGKGYVINVASFKNGVGYGKWTHVDGWSESVVEYIRMLEQAQSGWSN